MDKKYVPWVFLVGAAVSTWWVLARHRAARAGERYEQTAEAAERMRRVAEGRPPAPNDEAEGIALLEAARSEAIARGYCTEWLFDAWGGWTRQCQTVQCSQDMLNAITRARTTCDRLGYS